MKLRENIYQLKVYQPKYSQYQERMGKTLYEKSYLAQFKRIIAKAEEGVAEGMDETRSLFRDTMTQLLDFFKESARNAFLVRFLLRIRTSSERFTDPKRRSRFLRPCSQTAIRMPAGSQARVTLSANITTYPHSIFQKP